MKLKKIAEAERILVYGYGREGQAAFDFLSTRFPDKHIKVFDENPFLVPKDSLCPKSEEVPWCVASPQKCNVDIVVVSPGIPRPKLAHMPSEKLTSNTEIFFENLPEKLRKKVIGISGTKGKSTTTKFCTEMLQEAHYKTKACGNYGVPLLEVFDDFMAGDYDFLVAELSSFQLENLKVSPGIALFLNIYSDHLDRHKTQKNYFEAKKNLWAHQKKGDIFITPHSAPICKEGICTCSCHNSSPLSKEFFPNDSVFQAPYFLDNFGTVGKLAERLNISQKTVQKVARNFTGLPHRLEFFAEKQGIKFYDDSLSTNPDSTIASVDFFGKKLGSIILGGQDRKSNFDKLIETIEKRSHAHIIILDSEVRIKLLNSCRKIDYKQFHIARNLKEAVDIAFEVTPKNTSCLLSTAAPSFDLFKNYEEKGNLFKEYVLNK